MLLSVLTFLDVWHQVQSHLMQVQLCIWVLRVNVASEEFWFENKMNKGRNSAICDTVLSKRSQSQKDTCMRNVRHFKKFNSEAELWWWWPGAGQVKWGNEEWVPAVSTTSGMDVLTNLLVVIIAQGHTYQVITAYTLKLFSQLDILFI
jgi:hypothetical protein